MKVLLIIGLIFVVLALVFYFVGKRAQKKQEESQAQLEAVKQTVSILVIDKGKIKFKDAGFPAVVVEKTPKRSIKRYLYQNGYDKRIIAAVYEIPVDADEEQIARIITGRK